jgi:hypothetical protein
MKTSTLLLLGGGVVVIIAVWYFMHKRKTTQTRVIAHPVTGQPVRVKVAPKLVPVPEIPIEIPPLEDTPLPSAYETFEEYFD